RVKAVGLAVAVALVGLAGLGAWRGIFLPLSSTFGLEKIIKAETEKRVPNPNLQRFEYEGGTLFALHSNSEKKTLYIGDSFMEQYSFRIDHLILQNRGNTNSAVFAVKGGCLPVLKVVGKSKVSMNDYPECTKRIRSGIRYARRQDVDTVVIGAAWPYYFSEAAGYYYEDKKFSGKLSDTNAAARAYHDLEVMLDNMVKAGKKVYLILNSPMSEYFDPKNMVKRTLFPLGFKIRRSEIHKSVFFFRLNYHKIHNNLFTLGKKTGVHIIDPMDYLCHGDVCFTLREDGEPLYLDAAHLRPLFVKENVTYLDETILR
ncbi:MAG: hypothetical protein NC211_09140, partial [Alistipes senegalensis]|nr:hypothetical protein [Oxalobacter formigenes]MCM1281973.1 hypothetical protein [Alistipes senegalensis]